MQFREIDELYLYEFLKNFGTSIIGVFIPVYILSQGFSIYHAGLFILISGFTGLTLSYPISKIVSRKGFKHGLAASYLFILPGLILIQVLELSLALIVASGILYNIGRVIHSISINAEFAVDSKKKTRGSDSGKMLSLPNTARVIAPVLGGAIFASLGFHTLLLISITFLGLSIIPLLVTADHRDTKEYSFRDLKDYDLREVVPLFISRGIDAVSSVDIFAIFMFVVIGGTVDVGWVRSLDSLGFVLTGFLTGTIIQRFGSKKPLIIGAVGNGILNMTRGFLSTPLQAFTLSFLAGIMFQIYHVPLYSRFADMAEKSDILEFYALRKTFVGLGNILVVTTLFTFDYFYSLETGFKAVFILGGLAMIVIALKGPE
ncbi:MFS transporter [Candidatus Nanosalina sp. VS9-1]|uniref:MFS transporter n=1 Tax=Candidatus Nanosalina sp. VS9-1 TaxID=3388566 RepID=UPI0039E17566